MAIEVFGRAVPDQIDAEVSRPLVHRSGEGVVGYGQHVVRAGQVRYGAQVGDLQQRIARRFHQNQAGLRSQRVFERLRVGLVHLGSRHTQPGQQVQQHRRRAPVGGPLPDHVVTGGHQGQHGGGECGHPGCGDHRCLGVLQFRDHCRDLRVIGVAVAGVETLAPPVDGGLRELLRILGPERRRLVDGRCHGTAGMDVAIGVNGNRADAARHGSPPRGPSGVTPQAWPTGTPMRTNAGNFGRKLPPARGT
jgi:hypothetical protein